MKIRTILILAIAAIVAAVISFWVGQQAYGWMPPQASAEAVLVDNLFSFLVTIGAFIFLGVSGAIAYSVLFHRAGKYDTSDGPPIEGNITLEVVWTAIPFALVIWIAAYSFQIYDQMSILGPMEHVHMGMATAAAVNQDAGEQPIEVLARQWTWEFRYPDQNISSTELHLPSNQRAVFRLKSEDVIHGFFIPAFRVKQDVIPGQEITFEFTPIREGKYRLRDSQYSGTYFAAMQADVVVESPEDYRQWLAQAAAQTPMVAYNEAFEDYSKATAKDVSAGWKTVPPAPPPLVNYSGSPLTEE
ncbi:cytochrome c oxidase subunit ii [Leptolyngbya sp. Heron Island J]|uniref:cytochrome c oxidase subunit II n=1 Tax=Leptolyngbya sp. Heron Island J TaxID=1385935 RepID=UPI0003B9A7BC|nr:cytochrome c oxidase subunit II [Leptolyngbya sp. Heron Island J]ESA36401.1 cytochrome c oxidase subunit ii [Leptolyngbya sp. Heron Island J]